MSPKDDYRLEIKIPRTTKNRLEKLRLEYGQKYGKRPTMSGLVHGIIEQFLEQVFDER